MKEAIRNKKTDSLLIKNGYVIDPASGLNGKMDVLIQRGCIAKISKSIAADGANIIEANERLVMPGLIDVHTHLRQPGREDEETIRTASLAGAKGGFTTICAMPNTEPVCDNRNIVEFIKSEASRSAVINVLPIGAVSVGQQGKNLAEFFDMKEAGVVAVSDDGHSIADSHLMRKALEYAKMCGIPVIAHCEDQSLSEGGVMNEGYNSTRLGMIGVPNMAEALGVARETLLSELTGAHLHIAHVSTRESVRIIRDAKKRGVNITAETCPHYFSLTDDNIAGFNTNFKVNPPLRKKEDLLEIKAAIKDKTIDIISTDHAPHTEAEKDVEFDLAPCGIIGLETALSITVNSLIEEDIIRWPELVELMANNPAKVFNLTGKGSLLIGSSADIIIVDPEAEWIVTKESILSKSKNSPYIGKTMKGKVLYTICNGKIVYQ